MSGPPTGTRILALVVVSLALRPVISSLPPLALQIQQSMAWTTAQLGLLTALPVLLMAVGAPVAPVIARELGRARAVVLGLSLICAATASRFLAEGRPWLLLISACIGGAGIAITAGMLPGFVREWFPGQMTATTGMTTGMMIIGAAAAAFVAVPLAVFLGSWALALGAWSIPTLAALVIWIIVTRPGPRPIGGPPVRVSLPVRNAYAWAIAAFLALNGLVFYALVAWLATSYDERGWTAAEGGALLGFGTAMQIFGALLLPRLAQRLHRGVLLLYVVVIVSTSAALVLMGAAPAFATWVAVGVVEVGLGAAFALALAFIPQCASTPDEAARIAALAFLVGYGTASVGPVLFGALAGVGGWSLFYGILAGIAILQIIPATALARRGLA